MDRLRMYLLVQRGYQSFFAFPYKLHVILVILFSGQIHRAKNSADAISSFPCFSSWNYREHYHYASGWHTGRSIMLSRHNAHLIDGTSECFKKLWTLFVLYQFVVEIPVLPEIRAGALRPCNETYRKNRKTDMRDSDICILQLRLAVIWNIENITDMQNVEGKWSVESL